MPVDPLSPEATVTCLSDVSAVSRKCDLDLAEEALRTFAGAVVPLDVVALHDDVTTDAARATFIERHVGVVAVFDAEDRALGAITWRELALSHDAVAVGEIVKPFGATFGEDAPLLHVLPALVGAGVAGVLTHDGDLVGVLAASDAVRWLARRAGFDV
jgi:CBS-domain-containing membrane protein